MKFKYYNMLLGVLLMVSCNKGLQVLVTPDFDVTTDAATYKVGQEITFNLTGNAHIISFYSGETLKDYAFKDGRVIDVTGAGVTMAFQNSVQLGTQVNQLSVLYSTDFKGDYSSLATVKAATWTDITSRFGPLATTATFLPAVITPKVITDLIIPGKPIYIAYKYVTTPQIANGFVRQWFIQTFAIKSNAVLDGSIPLTITDQASAGFRIVDQNIATAPARSSVTSTRVTLYGNAYVDPTNPLFNSANPIFDPKNPIYDPTSLLYQPTAVRPIFVPYDPASLYNDPSSENWAVSKAIYTDKVDLGPDWSTSIKGISNPKLVVYRYTYTKAGTYKAVFIASNNTIDDVKQVVKIITFTITP